MLNIIKNRKTKYGLMVIVVLFAWIFSCESNNEDKIITPENPDEKNTPDPSFNASAWILYSK